MSMELVGMMSNSFKNSDGEIIHYAKLYVVREPDTREAEYTQGMVAEPVKVRPEMLKGLQLGDKVNVLYDKNGRVVQVELLPEYISYSRGGGQREKGV